MATKSRNDWTVVWSILAIVLAILTIIYCMPSIVEMISNGWERSTRAIAYFTRIIRGGTA
ncbi:MULTISPECIES: hypothetical protein [Sporosarcina]|uniref:Uncharacterized protein n=1 Tax=Sporosarcina contaminans TaxID=633403 RepID=A0ABW3TYU5_9BACL